MSQVPPEPKPKPRKIKPQPRKIKPSPKMDKDLRNIREMPKRNPEAMVPKPAKGIMGSTEAQAQARQQKALDDMRKRMMLRPKRELKNN